MKRTPLKRTAMKRSPKKRRVGDMSATAIEVRDRSRGRCEAGVSPDCTGRGEHLHHKLMRSQGGADIAANVIDLCLPCHTHVHANPKQSYELGYLAHAWD